MKRIALLVLVIAYGVCAGSPFADLTGEEILQAVKIVKGSGKFSENVRFPIIAVDEPPKAEVLALKKGQTLPRRVLLGVLDKKGNYYREISVDLNEKKLVKNIEMPGVQPPILLEEYDQLSSIVKQDPQWQAAIRKRGIQNFDEVYVDSWTPGVMTAAEQKAKKRLLRGLSYFKGTRKNYYGRPIEGILVTVDIGAGKVLEVRDTGVVPIAAGPQEFDPESNAPLRKGLKPLATIQKEGPSFILTAQSVEWENWKFEFSMHPQRGLTLYRVGYKDKNKLRSILYKGNLSDMVVPYGDADVNWTYRNAFDVGEYGVGRTAHALTPYSDAPENAVFFDATFANDVGEPFVIPKAVALYERETGILWKHFDQNTRTGETRRNRELVLSFTTTVGNYDYSVGYIFHQDGNLDVQVELTGILLAKGSKFKQNPCVGDCLPLVEANIVAPNHQHFFGFRMDLDIDGVENLPVEMNVASVKSRARNPAYNVFEAKRSDLKSEKEAARDLNFSSSRKWKVLSTKVTNALGHPTGYALMPGENSPVFLQTPSQIWKRADFIHHHVWFTRYHDVEQSGAGDYPNQDVGEHGLTQWVKNNEKLDGEDSVLWYSFGITHTPRPEDWPVMPTHRAGFRLMPFNFFSRNPAMDVPPVVPAR